MSVKDVGLWVYAGIAVVLLLISVSYLFLALVNPRLRASVFVRCIYFFVDSMSFVLASLAAGDNPFIPIETLRPYVVGARLLMLLAAVYFLVVTILEVLSKFRLLPYPWKSVVSDLHRQPDR